MFPRRDATALAKIQQKATAEAKKRDIEELGKKMKAKAGKSVLPEKKSEEKERAAEVHNKVKKRVVSKKQSAVNALSTDTPANPSVHVGGYDLVPGPHRPNSYNREGKAGLKSKIVKVEENGDLVFRAIVQWQDVAVLEWAMRKAGPKTTKETYAQYEDASGILSASDLGDETLVEWKGKGGDEVVVKTREVRTVWWQVKSPVGVWIEVEMTGPKKSGFLSRMPFSCQDVAKNVVKMMNKKLRQGRTAESGYNQHE
ncbi:hypothetical protein LTR78_006941 [Recurvomyces mirabilis]|uniref:Uncharacterized protein n=1 Tax=Recurvomyces mirabilis TaxID=574656 RepID=A0AAE1BZ35_9PEZI|nr:hypothetical protein LTR78_006941 [Recurvomyces mirabilis]KAK5153325.1 hypothetical protein LTS14_007494 [Recurvomyces mirabilis]